MLEDTYIFFYYCIFIMFSRFIQGCSMCQYFIPFFHLFTYFIFCHPGSSLRLRLFSICSEQDCSSLKCLDLSLQWLLLFRSTGSRHMDCSSCGSQALESRLSSRGTCSSACDIFPDQGSNPSPLYWQADSSPTVPPRKFNTCIFLTNKWKNKCAI